MKDDMWGLPEFHFLLHLSFPSKDDAIGVPEYVALLDEDFERAQGQANIQNSRYVFEEMIGLRPSVPTDHSLVGAILEAEEAAGVRWAA